MLYPLSYGGTPLDHTRAAPPSQAPLAPRYNNPIAPPRGRAMTTADRLYLALSDQPNDWATRAVLADWFEDAGQLAVAACMRWMVRQHKRPYPSTRGTSHWFNAPRVTTDNDPESDLPEAVYNELREPAGLDDIFRSYPTLRAADEDLYAAWARACAKGWCPDERRRSPRPVRRPESGRG